MFKKELRNSDGVRLIKPNVERDAALGVSWLNSEFGSQTMSLMGSELTNGTTLAAERTRVQDIIDNENHYNWMIEKDGRVVGSVWIDLKEKEGNLEAWLSIMIGDPKARKHGVGLSSCKAVIDWAFGEGSFTMLKARHHTQNLVSPKLLTALGFRSIGDLYQEDQYKWQDYALSK
jgi:RimJ/RimL family protein N-acetyltransferase